MLDSIEISITNPSIPRSKTPENEANLEHATDTIKSEHFFKRLLRAPCGDLPKGINYVTILVCGLLGWALLYTLVEREVQPGGQLFMLIALTVLSYLSGWLISFIHVPPLLGMLICGIVLRNIGFFHVTGEHYMEILAVLREISLTMILITAGLGLDAGVLKRLSFVVAKLAMAPCVTEAVGVAVAARFLADLPWLWGFLLGFVLSAVSPAVVVPSLLHLKEKGYGETKGISTLVIAASSIDDIISISCFGVFLGMIFSQGTGDLIRNLVQGPLEIVIGSTIGFGWGFISACIPHRNEEYLVAKRTFMVGGGGLTAVLGSQVIGYSGAGPLATIILSFLACLGWKWQGWSKSYNPVAKVFSALWTVSQPILFGLIGTEVVFANIDVSLIGQGLMVLGAGLLVRITTCFLVLIGTKLNVKEVIFINLAWLPKATIQAALGPVALDIARKNDLPDAIPYAEKLLTIAVLSILITAPIGAIGIALAGPKLLDKKEIPKSKESAETIEASVMEQVHV